MPPHVINTIQYHDYRFPLYIKVMDGAYIEFSTTKWKDPSNMIMMQGSSNGEFDVMAIATAELWHCSTFAKASQRVLRWLSDFEPLTS